MGRGMQHLAKATSNFRLLPMLLLLCKLTASPVFDLCTRIGRTDALIARRLLWTAMAAHRRHNLL